MPEWIGLDFETYGAVDLKKHGLYRYVYDPTFRPLIASVTSRTSGMKGQHTIDFVNDGALTVSMLRGLIEDKTIVAHNAPFEQIVLRRIGIDLPSRQFIDSAVVARAAGAGSKLEVAAPQLLNKPKLASGKHLINLFSKPSKAQLESGSLEFDRQVVIDHPLEWDQFKIYCEMDSELGLNIVEGFYRWLTMNEHSYQAITMDMNNAGWQVDLDLVQEMQRRYEKNKEQELLSFRIECAAPDLNLNSLPQLKKWCADRGIKANSFAEKPVEKLLIRLETKLASMTADDPKWVSYDEVHHLLKTKQVLGGSSLKKLQVILDTAAVNGNGNHRLYDQYVHCGAGQTLRTTGRAAQMQNLKRLKIVADMDELLQGVIMQWDNTKLAENLRQVFTASHPAGQLVVGDFSSVESRGLAWLAGESWKVQSFRTGLDLYKVLASKIYNVQYTDVTKLQRQTGKVGELSCGYGAGPDAVVSFAEGMGVQLEKADATKLVWNWRDANPVIVNFWAQLDTALHDALEHGHALPIGLPDNMLLTVLPCWTPQSLMLQHPGAKSLQLKVTNVVGDVVLSRFFHGCYNRGRNLSYYRPSNIVSGVLWRKGRVNPKSKVFEHYSIYGGKLAGILTQSFCRELFFEALAKTDVWLMGKHQVKLVGQFHDEIVLDWEPGSVPLSTVMTRLEEFMSGSNIAPSFPLAAEVKHDYRYTK